MYQICDKHTNTCKLVEKKGHLDGNGHNYEKCSPHDPYCKDKHDDYGHDDKKCSPHDPYCKDKHNDHDDFLSDPLVKQTVGSTVCALTGDCGKPKPSYGLKGSHDNLKGYDPNDNESAFTFL